MAETGDKAADFSLPDADMHLVSLGDYRGRWVVLYFYPKDDTPGCTTEAVEFSALEDSFARLGAVVLGVSPDDCISHADFRDKHGLSVRLLSDTEAEVARAYGVWQQKKDGREGVVRSTFLIDPSGCIAEVWRGVSAKGHAQVVLERLRELQGGDPAAS